MLSTSKCDEHAINPEQMITEKSPGGRGGRLYTTAQLSDDKVLMNEVPENWQSLVETLSASCHFSCSFQPTSTLER